MRIHHIDNRVLAEWLRASITDVPTVRWLHNAGLPSAPVLGPCHAGQGGVLVPEGALHDDAYFLSLGEAKLWSAGDAAARNYETAPAYLRRCLVAAEHDSAGQLDDTALRSAHARMVANRKAWFEVFARFTVYARWSFTRDNAAGAHPAPPSSRVIELMRILNSELVIDLDLHWNPPLSVEKLIDDRVDISGGGIYLLTIESDHAQTVAYAGVSKAFADRMRSYAANFRSSAARFPDSIHYQQAVGAGTVANALRQNNKFYDSLGLAQKAGLGMTNLFVRTAVLPSAWLCGPAVACYFREGRVRKNRGVYGRENAQMQLIYCIDNFFASEMQGELALNHETSKNRRLLISCSGSWPWAPKYISPDCVKTPPQFYEKMRSLALENPLWDGEAEVVA